MFHHPQDEAKKAKEGVVMKEPTYDEAQEEIVKQSGLVKDGANKSKGDASVMPYGSSNLHLLLEQC